MDNSLIVKVANVSNLVTEEILRELFEILGPVKDLKLYTSPHNSELKEGLITFCSQAVAAAALHLTGTDLAGRTLFVSSTVLATSTPSGHAPVFGQSTVQPCGIMSTPFKNPNVTPAIIQCDPVRAEEMSRTIYIGNLPISITEDQLREFLRSVGNLVNMKIAGENTASITGSGKYAFLEFETQNQAEEALKLNGVVLGDRAIRVNHSRNAIYKPPARINASMRRHNDSSNELPSKRSKESLDKVGKVRKSPIEYYSRSSVTENDRKSRPRHYSRSPDDSRYRSENRSHRYRDESPRSRGYSSPERSSRSHNYHSKRSPSSSPSMYKSPRSKPRTTSDSKYRHSDYKQNYSPKDRSSHYKDHEVDKSRRLRSHAHDYSPSWNSSTSYEKQVDYAKKDYGTSSSKYKKRSSDGYYRDKASDRDKLRSKERDRDGSKKIDSREKDRYKDKSSDRDGYSDTEKETEKNMERDTDKEKSSDRDKAKHKDLEKDKSKTREKELSRYRKRSKDKKSEKSKSEKSKRRSREKRGHSKERSHDKNKLSEKEYKKDKYK